MPGNQSETTRAAWQEMLVPLRAEPSRTAILTDFDGTLAPIVEHAEDAALPSEAREILVALTERYALVGAVSGRAALDVRERIGLDTIAYAGNHGLEQLLPGESELRPDPSVAGRERQAAAFIATVDDARLSDAGIWTEDKGPIITLHLRGVADEARAEAVARQVAEEAERAGLDARWGRKVLELRPLGGGGKEAAISSLLAAEGLDRVAYAGDDRTDIDAFRRIGELREAGELVAGVRVGVLSAEGPAEIATESDITVAGPAGWLEMLAWLAGAE